MRGRNRQWGQSEKSKSTYILCMALFIWFCKASKKKTVSDIELLPPFNHQERLRKDYKNSMFYTAIL
jgi:hypothetical protein